MLWWSSVTIRPPRVKTQTFTQQMKDVGIEIRIDQHADSEFATILGNWDYDISFSGYSVSADATEGTKQFYYSENNEGIGGKEIDALIDAMTLIGMTRNVTLPAMRLRRSTWLSLLPGYHYERSDFVMVQREIWLTTVRTCTSRWTGLLWAG